MKNFTKAVDKYFEKREKLPNNSPEELKLRKLEAERLEEFSKNYRGMSLYQVAKEGLSESSLYRIKNLDSKLGRMEFDTVLRLCIRLDIRVEEFVRIVLVGEKPEEVLPKNRLHKNIKGGDLHE